MAYERLAIRLPRLVAGLLMLAGITVNFANVIGRYFFANPIFWAEEAMIYLTVWSIFIAMIAVTASRAHLSMDLLASMLPARLRRFLDYAIAAVGAATMLFLCVQSYETIMRLWNFGMKTISLQIPMALPHLSMLVGFSFSALVIVLAAFRKQ
jgi:TRAP-type C4-dicarboxylate transport system permease small subunit